MYPPYTLCSIGNSSRVIFRIGIKLPRALRGGFARLNAVQNMSGERQWKRKEIESIPEYWSEMSRRTPGKRESLHLFFRKTLVPFIWFLWRLFAWFGDGRTRRRRFKLPCSFPPLRFICWTIIGIGAFHVFLYFIGTLPFGYSFLLACTDFSSSSLELSASLESTS